jgi:carbonic anhydrase/acetyltransferase-like protein (isoleucine patch superfamily)
MPLYRLGEHAPALPETAFIAAEATLIGRVTLGERCSVWPGAVLRADNEPIVLADDCNVQEGAVLHTDPGFPLKLAAGVSVGHQAMLHGCTVGEGSLIGIQAVVLNGAVIGKHCLVGAGALVTEGKTFPDGSMILGSPAKVVRPLTEAEITRLGGIAGNYASRGALYQSELVRID